MLSSSKYNVRTATPLFQLKRKLGGKKGRRTRIMVLLFSLMTMFYQESFLPFWLDSSDTPITLWGSCAGQIRSLVRHTVQESCHTAVLLLQSSSSTPLRLLSVAVGEPRPHLMALTALLANKGWWASRLYKFRRTGDEEAVAVKVEVSVCEFVYLSCTGLRLILHMHRTSMNKKGSRYQQEYQGQWLSI